MPATGVRPPFLMFVAVRAIAPGGRDAAEQRRDDVGRALRHELHVRLVPRADHAVGDDGGEQRLHRAEQRDGDRRRTSVVTSVKLRCGHRGMGQRGADLAEPAADRLDREVEQRDRDGRPDQRDEWARESGGSPSARAA